MGHILLLTIFAVLGARAEIIDRIAVRIDKYLITDSEIRKEIRLVALIEGTPIDFGPESRRKTAERLVDQWMIGREMEIIRKPAAEAQILEKLFARLIRDRFGGDEKRYQSALREYGVTDAEVRAHIRRQFTFVRFLSIRFRPGIQISDKEVEDYFQREIAPKLKAGSEKSRDDYHDEIERKLIEQRVDQQAEEWLKSARERTTIHFEAEAFK
jgi:peptidyl-prolyl cis-trans isomerase SurA